MPNRKEERLNPFLAILSSLLVLAALIGFFQGRDATTVGILLGFGSALAVVAVFEPRMEGSQEFGPTGAKITLAQIVRMQNSIARAEEELSSGAALPTLEDLQ